MKLFGRNELLLLLLSSVGIISQSVSRVEAQVIQVALNKLQRSPEAVLLLSKAHAGIATSDVSTFESSADALSHLEAAETRIYSGEGSHTIQVQVGGQPRELIIDTGSGKTAFICEGCHDCGESHANAPFRLTAKTKYLACDLSASPLPAIFSRLAQKKSANSCMKCVESKCEYSQTYVEGDYWVAYKVSDEMQFAQNQPKFKSSVDFGCIYKQDGVFNMQASDGIMGFSRHPDSIFEQFYRSGVTKSRIFSQCLGSQGGMLTLGGVDLSINYDDKVMYTPIRDTGYQYWTVTLLSIEIGSVTMDVDAQVFNRERGCVFDSGTTFVYLPLAAEEPFKAAWKQAVGNDQFPISSSYFSLSEAEVAQFPSICFLFLNNVKLCMVPELYFYRNAPGRYAGTIFFGDGAKSTIIGASALTNYNVIYDIDNSRIGVARANCEASVRTGDDKAAAMVELSLNPGGDKFRSVVSPLSDAGVATQWLLAAITFFGIAGLVNALWAELGDVRAEKKLEAAMNKALDKKKKKSTSEQQQQLEESGGAEPKCIDSSSLSFDEDDNVSAFSFILMHDDQDRENQDPGHK